jgi:hypothetical protein
MPPTPDPYGDALKIVQIAFYVVGAIVAILTYRAAKRRLLNTVNTEYQKRVMDRLQKLSEDLYSEFDPSSANFWAKMRPVHDAIDEINEVFAINKDEILAEKKYYYRVPYTADAQRIRNLLDPVVSDPFIPDSIREAVLDLLENRLIVMQTVYATEFEKYATWRRANTSLSPNSTM